ncbi:hypothetical protein ACZ91_64365 [Streptomyces regensis]|nr:hypothetical protein ACZ91_64365 [Streptomyces regensis]
MATTRTSSPDATPTSSARSSLLRLQAGTTDEARRLLDALMAMADQWKSHPDFPAVTRAVRAVHDADTTAER